MVLIAGDGDATTVMRRHPNIIEAVTATNIRHMARFPSKRFDRMK